MKMTVYQNDFIEAFREAGQQDNFSYEGLKALFAHIEDYEERTGYEIELDAIALSLDYSEWSNIEEFINAHGYKFLDHWGNLADDYEEEESEQRRETMLDFIRDYTIVIDVDGERFITQYC